MNADAIRHFFNYHFTETRALLNKCALSLSQEQFVQEIEYSHGSIRNQLIHIISADNTWFNPLRGLEIPDALNPQEFPNWESVRICMDQHEQDMRRYLEKLNDEMLLAKPYRQEEDMNLILWQVLLHVVNHGTDHRAQILRIMHDMGLKTVSQDYIFYVYDHP